ncbi:MAG: hypothetical protein AAFV45_00075 [Pseudomonadota bacterium]
MEPDAYHRALIDPSGAFPTPESLAEDSNLTREQKVGLLRRWEYQAAEEDVALEEGMPGEETGLLRRILVALGELAGPLDLERTEPSKQHGIPRSATNSQNKD